tara:strand:- start:2068 stop:2379 length:312 start_codon:yes stop_codon:yes gene_type:complete
MSKDKTKHKDLQEIYLELAYLRAKMDNVSNQMQELQQVIRESSNQNQVLRVSEPYEHPWDQHIRKGFVTGRDRFNTEGKVYTESVTTRLGFSGGTATTQGPTN